MSLRLIVRVDDAGMAANVGGAVLTTFQTFTFEHPTIEGLLRRAPGSLSHAQIVGAEVVEPPPAESGDGIAPMKRDAPETPEEPGLREALEGVIEIYWRALVRLRDGRHVETDDNRWVETEWREIEEPSVIAEEALEAALPFRDAAYALLSAPPSPRPGREEVARIIDPSSWAVMDSYLAQMLRKYRDVDAGYDPEAFKDKASLAKADQILALLHPPVSGDAA